MQGVVDNRTLDIGRNEYRHNPRFRLWVHEYCKKNGISVEEALFRREVNFAAKQFEN